MSMFQWSCTALLLLKITYGKELNKPVVSIWPTDPSKYPGFKNKISEDVVGKNRSIIVETDTLPATEPLALLEKEDQKFQYIGKNVSRSYLCIWDSGRKFPKIDNKIDLSDFF